MENELTELILEREGCPIHYWVGGPEGAPLVVFTHGAYIDHREWNATLPLVIAAGFRVMTWDVRGHGHSRPGVLKLTTALDDMLALLDVLKVKQATFVGHSMGGNIDQELVFRHPKRVKALVMLDCTWNFQKLTSLEAFTVKIGVPMIGWYSYKTLVNQMANTVAAKPADRAYLREAFSILSKKEFVQVMAETTLCLHYEPNYHIPKPMLLMVGDRDNTGNIRKVAPIWAKHEQRCTYVVIPNALHGANLDNPEFFHKTLLDFLNLQAK
jgi:3-oxoadipate enol-lactonase